jgi:outer membrane protein
MNKIISWVSAAVSLIALLIALWLFFKADRVVYVDSAKLVNGYKGMEVARKEFQKKTAVWKSNVDTLVKEIQQEIVKFEKQSGKMTSKEKELTKQLIQTKQQQLAEYQRATNEKAGQEDNQMTKKVLDEINAYIKDYGKNHQYKIILAASNGNIAYAEEALDVTDEVLAGLNKNYSGK